MYRYKSLKKIVKTLLLKLKEEPKYNTHKADLIKVRAFFRWVSENIT